MVAVEEATNVLYTQLICKKSGKVLGQVSGPTEQTAHCNKVWAVQPDQELVVTSKTDVAEPSNFFGPVPKNSNVYVYGDFLEEEKPTDIEPTWVGAALVLEQMKNSAFDVAGNTWTAFNESGEVLGSSEF
ncbi:hypothetical protein [Pseudovibrio sp. Ad26]|uniref:hypothetical protein n=1 Tax=Pseudovibrio sp. Ad26 TaxID=989410 RepID=UPI0007AE62E4|nr:hypothetical protein [Pseudovibrio sp. Ad26]KZL16528.1 hypothetical protein PsAD26_00303 [Pseudovibrio sp. Ad26]